MYTLVLLAAISQGVEPALDARASRRLINQAEQHVINYRKAFPPKTVFAPDPETGIPVPQRQVWSDTDNPLVGRTITIRMQFNHLGAEDRTAFGDTTALGTTPTIDVLVGHLRADYTNDLEVADVDPQSGRRMEANEDRIAALDDAIRRSRARRASIPRLPKPRAIQ